MFCDNHCQVHGFFTVLSITISSCPGLKNRWAMLFIESRSVRGFIVYAMIVPAKHTNQTFQRLCDLTFPSTQKRKRIAVKDIGSRSRVSESWIQNSGIPLNSGAESSLLFMQFLLWHKKTQIVAILEITC
jgi:hypothetical protein